MKLELSNLSATLLMKPLAHLDVVLVHMDATMARALLKANTHNRTISNGGVDAYRGDMAMDRWAINGEAIKFGTDGTLLDGGHRLTSIAGLPDGKTVPVIVFRGINPATQESMDGGRKRTFADQYNIGLADTDKLGMKVSAALRALSLFAADGMGKKLTAVTLGNMARLHPDMLDSVKTIQAALPVKTSAGMEPGLNIRPSVMTALHYITHHMPGRKGQAAVFDMFLETLTTGRPKTAGDAGDPAYAWYMRWNALMTRPNKKRVDEAEAVNGTLWAWTLYRDGETVPTMKGWLPETYELDAHGTNPSNRVISRAEALGVEFALANPAPTPEEAKVEIVAEAVKKAKGGKKGSAAPKVKPAAKTASTATPEAPKAKKGESVPRILKEASPASLPDLTTAPAPDATMAEEAAKLTAGQ